MLLEKFKNYHIILASGSPRRQELFKELGLDYTIKVNTVEEKYPSDLKAEEITNFLALLKAKSFENELKNNELVITSDTIVWLKNKALEKPKNKQEAIDMLLELSNKNHKVITS
ncbi:Maf family protein, partial [Lutibacter sp.]|uniref:Maf family protein n=1 Tax=Lutibacter sp. TaxID=1925666 RepID=UPI0035698160